MPPIRVLQIMPAMDAGGMETFVMNVYRAVDRSQVQFDFLYHYDKPCFYDTEIEALGGHITKLTVRQDNNIPKYLHDLRAFVPRTRNTRSSTGITAALVCFIMPWPAAAGCRCGQATATTLPMSTTWWASWTG